MAQLSISGCSKQPVVGFISKEVLVQYIASVMLQPSEQPRIRPQWTLQIKASLLMDCNFPAFHKGGNKMPSSFVSLSLFFLFFQIFRTSAIYLLKYQ